MVLGRVSDREVRGRKTDSGSSGLDACEIDCTDMTSGCHNQFL